MKIPVLDKTDDWINIKEKLKEEHKELQDAIDEDDLYHIAEEAFDLIQVCIGVLEELKEEGLDIERTSQIHLGKLVSRGWKFKEILQINKL